VKSILLAFAVRFLHRGYVVLFGVALGVIGGLNEFFNGAIKLAPWMSFGIVGASLVAAGLWAGFDLVSERDRTIASLKNNAPGTADPRYAPLSDMLGESMTCGFKLSGEHDWTALNAWEESTRSIVAAAYGEGQAAHVFTRELKGGTVYSGREIFKASIERPPPKAEVINSVNALLGRMSALVLRGDFDPAQWRAFDASAFREYHARPITQKGDHAEWTCPWCLHEHEYWEGHCQGCHGERAGDFVYPQMEREGRPAGVQASPLEEWLEGRIADARQIQSQRGARSDEWFYEQMNAWDFENVSRMHDGPDAIAPDLVDRYREDPRTGRPDGLKVDSDGRFIVQGERDRYYGQRIGWMHATLGSLADGRLA
jgi:hypothetical protein